MHHNALDSKLSNFTSIFNFALALFIMDPIEITVSIDTFDDSDTTYKD